MSETACLHIQSRDADPIRVVELPGVSVRIGRASYCEVRLPEPGLAEEECHLRRRGSTWHLVPVASPCAITIEGHAVERPRPLPYGVALRAGEHRLTLRPAGASPPEWGHAPSECGTRSAECGTRSAECGGASPPEWGHDQAPTAVEVPVASVSPHGFGPGAPAEADHLARWQSRQEGLLRTSREEKRWEARWKAVGEKLRSAGPGPSARPATPTVVAPPAPPAAPERPEGWGAADLPRRDGITSPGKAAPHLDPNGFPSVKSVATPPKYPAVAKVATPPKSPPAAVDPAPAARPSSAFAAPPLRYPPIKPVEPPAARAPSTPPEAIKVPVPPPAVEHTSAPAQLAPPRAKPPRPLRRPPADPVPIEPASSAGDSEPPAPIESESVAPPAPEPEAPTASVAPIASPPDAERPAPIRALGTARLVPRRTDRFEATDSPPDEPAGPPAEALELKSGSFAPETPPDQVALTPEPADDHGRHGEGQTVVELLPGTAPEALCPPGESPDEARPEPLPAAEEIPALPPGTSEPTDDGTPLPERLQSKPHEPEAAAVSPETEVAPPRTETEAAINQAPPPEEPEARDTGPPASESRDEAGRLDWSQPAPFVTDTGVRGAAGWAGASPEVTLSTTSWNADGPTRPAPPDAPERDELVPPRPARPREFLEADRPVSAREWPAARDILAAHQARPRPRPQTAARSTAGSRPKRPVPTPAIEPEHWTIPLWLGWLPMTGVALALGVGGVGLSWEWSQDAKTAGVVANHLARSELGAKLPFPPDEIPAAPWWKSTAGNLSRLAVALGVSGDPGLRRETRAALDTALQASPLQPVARFALAHSAGPEGGPAPLTQSLGLSRDVVALAWSGHQLLKAGKKEAALRAYHSALEMASTADLARLAPPSFNEDTEFRRYRLPGEDLIGLVVRDMADQPEWSYADWSAALPQFAVAPLVAARVLRERDRPSADAALEAIVSRAEQAPPARVPAAVHLAAQAEAHALKAEWARAEALYRQAIDRMPADRVRRSWWVNVADLAQRRNDDEARQAALDAANSHDPNDEITQRVVELQKFTGYRDEKASARARSAPKSAQKS